MPLRPSISTYSKGDGTTSKMRPASPSWGGGSALHGTNGVAHVSSPRDTSRSGSPAHSNTSSRRSSPLVPPHMLGSPGGNRAKSGRELQQHSRSGGGGVHGDRVSSPSGLGARPKRLAHDAVDGGGGGGGGGGLEGESRAEDSARIRVAVRVRPFSEKEKLAGTRCVISMSGNQTKILDPAYFDSEDGGSSPDDRSMWERTFSFDHSFWSHSSIDGNAFSSQANVHQALGEFLLDNACRGFNCSLFAYGQTGSGKTYTMLGDNSDVTTAAGEGAAGLIPRICVELFQRLGLAGGGGRAEQARDRSQASIQVSFCEIYNEQVRDLFCQTASGHGLRVREHPTKGAFVEGLSARPVTCYQQVQHLLEVGMSARATAATSMNEVSSRSHAIFTIYVTVTVATKLSHARMGGGGEADAGEAENDVSSRTSKICLVDLAGSERANSTGAKGERLREASNINKSLSTLSDVIKALAKRVDSGRGSAGGANESFIPYRNSMLTWLLKDSIGGNSKTVMLAAISPVAEAYQETMSTLRYVERAKDIINCISVNDTHTNPVVAKLREEIQGLQELLEKRDTAIVQHEEKEALFTAALERAHADDGDKISKALEAADSLQAALLLEKREHALVTASAAKLAASNERRHKDQLDELKETHEAALEDLRVGFDEKTKILQREATESLAEEVARGKEQAAEEQRQLRREWEEAAELEGDTKREVHREEMRGMMEQHKCEMDRVFVEAASELELSRKVAATTAAAAAAEMSEIEKNHAREMAEKEQAAEHRLLEDLRVLRETLEEEHVIAGENARCVAKAELAVGIEAAVKNAEETAEATRVTVLDDLHKQHDADVERINEAHSVAVRAAVEEDGERLRSEHKVAMQATVAARDAALREEHRENEKRLAEEHAADVEATIAELKAGLKVDHEEELARLRQENENAVAGVRNAADVRRTADLTKAAEDKKLAATAADNELARSMDALNRCHQEKLRTVREEHDTEIRRTTETEKLRSKAELAKTTTASASELEESQRGAARALEASERNRQDQLRTLREEHEAENKRATATANQRLKLALQDLAQKHEAVLAEAEVATTARLTALLEKKHQENLTETERRWKDDAANVRREAEERRKIEIAAADDELSATVAELKADAAVALAKEKDNLQQDLRRAEQDGIVELERVRATADEKLTAEHAVAAETLARSMEEATVEHAAASAALEIRHRDEISESGKRYEAEIGSLNARVNFERQQWESDLARAKGESVSSVAMAREEMKAELDTQITQHRDELQRVREEHTTQLERENLAAETRRENDLTAVREERTRSLAEAKQRTAESTTALQLEHRAALESLHREGKAEQDRIAEVASAARNADLAAVHENNTRDKETYQAKAAAASAATETRHQEELTKALEEGEKKTREVSAACEEANAAEKIRTVASLEKLKEAHQGEVLRLSEEHATEMATATARAEKQRADELAAAESQFNATKAELVEERTTFVARNLLELRAAKQEATAEVERVTKEATKAQHALEEEKSKLLSELKANHLEELEKRRVEGDADREAATVAASASATAAAEELKETELAELAEKLTASAAETLRKASETHTMAFAEAFAESEIKLAAALAAQEIKFTEARKAESDAHVTALASAEAARLSAEEAAEARFKYSYSELLGRVEASEAGALEKTETAAAAARERQAKHEAAIEALEKVHRAAFAELEERQRKEREELTKRAETAEMATAEVQASADELETRAAVVDEMLRASVGSKEEELAGHRSRVAQLQAYVARHEAASSSSVDTNNGDATARGGQRLSTTAARSVHQRIVDLRAMAGKKSVTSAAGGGASGGGGDCFGLAAFASTGFVGGLTLEKYTEELEVVLVRSTVESAVARQDHLEADMQVQSVTRQLVGLKLVHAQLCECLEDTQVKLEHKSQSAARRLLNSAARLAYEFAKPDRLSHGGTEGGKHGGGGGSSSTKSFSKTTPKAMSSQSSDKRSPLSRTQGGARRDSPAWQRSSTSTLDLNTTV